MAPKDDNSRHLTQVHKFERLSTQLVIKLLDVRLQLINRRITGIFVKEPSDFDAFVSERGQVALDCHRFCHRLSE